MKRMLITGMSGTGKSTVVRELQRRGWNAVDVDEGGYSGFTPAPDDELTGPGGGMDWVWQADRIQSLLDDASEDVLFLAGCSPNQGEFYGQLDGVILLTAPKDVIAERLRTRTTNAFGKRPDELERSLQLVDEIEPRLRRSAGLVIDTTASLEVVVDAVLEFAG